MELFSTYGLLIICSIVVILSFLFGEVSRKTNFPSVLMLIGLGIIGKLILDAQGIGGTDAFDKPLEILGTVGLIMIVLEAALELELKRDKLWPILKALAIALIGLLGSTWLAALILQYFIPEMNQTQAWLYATPLSILSSAIIIPSVNSLSNGKKEFHIYESTFSDILGIMLFYFLTGQLEAGNPSSGTLDFIGNLGLTLLFSVVFSYGLVLVFQNIRSHVKLFLLISVLLLLYSVGKSLHLSSLIIIFFYGLLQANLKVFFPGRWSKYLDFRQARYVYEGLHTVTGETAFIVRTFFFLIFGLTIVLSHLFSLDVALISGLILLSIYVLRALILFCFLGKDIFPQVFIAPRGLITILLFNAIPAEQEVAGFEPGILLFVIIASSLIMTFALIYDKTRSGKSVKVAQGTPVGYAKWKAPSIGDVGAKNGNQEGGSSVR